MKTVKKLLYLTLPVLLCMTAFSAIGGNTTSAFADSPAPRISYKIELENGTKFFYMRGSENDEEFLDLESGLYRSDTLENIYTIESIVNYGKTYQRYINQTSLVISDDGTCLANLPWTSNQGFLFFSKSGIAVEFYKNGSLIKQYNLSDLTKNKIGFDYSVSHVSWENYNKREFDATNNTLSVTILNGKTIIFDLTTGEIIRKKLSGGEIAIITIISLLGALVLFAIGFVIYKKRKKKAAKN